MKSIKEEVLKNSSEEVDKQFIPKASKYQDNEKILKALEYGIAENLPILIIGETGTGKTSAIRYLAHKTGNAFRRLNLNGSTSVDEFVGKILIKNGSTYWVDGILTEALRKGHWLLIDEINAGLPEVLFVLQSLLDDDGFIVLTDKEDKEIVRPHKNFRIFATCNPSENYSGTKELNKALMSRFPMVLNLDFLPKKSEIKVVCERTDIKTGDKEEVLQIEKMVDFANNLRASYKNAQIDFVMSTRELIYWTKMTKYQKNNIVKGAELTFLAKANADDRRVISDLLKVFFKPRNAIGLLNLLPTNGNGGFSLKTLEATEALVLGLFDNSSKSGRNNLSDNVKTKIAKGTTLEMYTDQKGEVCIVVKAVNPNEWSTFKVNNNGVHLLEANHGNFYRVLNGTDEEETLDKLDKMAYEKI